MPTSIASAFIPVRDPAASASWYAKHLALEAADCTTTEVEGDAAVCLFFTVRDPDGNVLLITDR